MRHKIFVLLLAITLSLSLSSCAKKTQPPEAVSSEKTKSDAENESEDASWDDKRKLAPDQLKVRKGAFQKDQVKLPDMSLLPTEENMEKDRVRTLAKLKKEGVLSENAPCEAGDYVLVNIKGAYDDGEEEDILSGLSIRVGLGSEKLDRLLEEQIVGMKEGEVKEISVSYPMDYENKDLAASSITYTVKVTAVLKTPEPTQAELNLVHAQIDGASRLSARLDLYARIYEYLLQNTTILSYPKNLVDEIRAEYQANSKDIFKDAQISQSAEDSYILAQIKERMLKLALEEKTGVHMNSEAFEQKMQSVGATESTDQGQILLYTQLDVLIATSGK